MIAIQEPTTSTSKDWLQVLQTEDRIWRRNAFDRVTLSGRSDHFGPVAFSLLGTCYSDYESGPGLFLLGKAAYQFFGPGFYGLEFCRPLNQPWVTPELAAQRGCRFTF